MKNILIVMALFLSSQIFAQQFNEINSNNVLNYVAASTVVTNQQMGNGNSIEVVLTNQVNNFSIFQWGENNNLNYFDYINRNIVIDNEVIMKGNNNTISVYGANSISQNMDITVIGNQKNLTIINR